jgi:hypothetical protein
MGENWLLPGGDEGRAERLPDKCTVELRAGDVVPMLTPGGGGEAHRRDADGRGRRGIVTEGRTPGTAARWRVIAAWLVLSVLAAAFLFGVAVAIGLCGTFGDTCSAEEERQIAVALVGALAVLCAGPVIIAVRERNPWWLVVPVVELGLITLWFATG